MTQKLIALVSTKPVLNLLSLRYLQPEEVLFVGTPEWHANAQHLQALIGRDLPVHLTEVRNPNDPQAVRQAIATKVRKLGWSPGDITVDLTGGSKIMSIIAYQMALEHNADIADVELVNGRYHLRTYHVENGRVHHFEETPLPTLITIADYLHAHVPGFTEEGVSRDQRGHIDSGGHFEATLLQTLTPHVDELLSGVRPAGVGNQIEIDLILRCGNNVGIVEAKTGANKAGIDQLDTAGNPTYLGSYTQKFLITGQYLSRAHKSLALAQQICVIELPGYVEGQTLPPQEANRLVRTIQQTLFAP